MLDEVEILEELNRHIERAGSQHSLANEWNIKQTTVSNIKTGKQALSEEIAWKIGFVRRSTYCYYSLTRAGLNEFAHHVAARIELHEQHGGRLDAEGVGELNKEALRRLFSVHTATLNKILEAAPDFPKPVHQTAEETRWKTSEVYRWLRSRSKAHRRSKPDTLRHAIPGKTDTVTDLDG